MSSEQQSQSKSSTASQQRPAQLEGMDLETAVQEIQPATLIQRAKLDPSSLSSGDVLSLQRAIGNRATRDLMRPAVPQLTGSAVQLAAVPDIQRDDDDPLTEGGVFRALSFYRMRSAQYTEAIIRQIQAGVGVPETGTPDATMVQAVARYQQVHSPLSVDGMAGPRTLPALFPSGLAQETEVEAFVGGARTVFEGDWATQTRDERADALIAQVNVRLVAAGVPEVTKVVQDLGGDLGRFAFSLWAIRLDQATLDRETLTEAQRADMADTVYHEARHAEQWYRIAQMLAGQGRTADQIRVEMGIPPDIAAEAFGHPLASGSMEALIADGWYQSIYGRDSAHRERVLGPTGTFEEYQNLPEESDAWRVGGGVTAAYTRPAAVEEEEAEGTGG